MFGLTLTRYWHDFWQPGSVKIKNNNNENENGIYIYVGLKL